MQYAISRSLRRRSTAHVIDFSGTDPNEVAIYGLADPRDLELVRYIGQTLSPRTRYRQHMNEAQICLPDELPWWIKSPQLRPLYAWIRVLYADECRMPLMMIVAWTRAQQVRQEEGRYIRE